MKKNKLIRNYKGKLNEIGSDSLVIRLALTSFDQYKLQGSFILRLWKMFI